MTEQKTEVKKNTALVKRTEQVLAQYPEGQYNRLLPTTTLLDNLGNFQEPKIEILQFDPKPAPDGADVYIDYRLGKGKRLFTKNALDKIAYAGGLSWYAPLCTTEERTKSYVRCKATAVIKKANGEPLMIARSKEIDLEVEEEKIRESYRKKVAEGKTKASEVEALVRRDLLQLRENMLQLCESKACNRVIRAAFGLKSSYKAEEIAKPFLMIRFDTTYDLSDPNVLRLLASSGKAAIGMLFPDVPDGTHQLAAPDMAAPAEAIVEGATENDLSDILDGQPEEEDEGVSLTPEQQRVIVREQRITELVDGCEPGALKNLFLGLFGALGYDAKNDPNGYIERWKKTNIVKAEQAKRKAKAEIIVELEEEQGGDPS